jgi:hypothetical protein
MTNIPSLKHEQTGHNGPSSLTDAKVSFRRPRISTQNAVGYNFFFIIIITSTRPKLVPNFDVSFITDLLLNLYEKGPYSFTQDPTKSITLLLLYHFIDNSYHNTTDPNVLANVPYWYKLEVDKLSREQHSNIHFNP